MSLCVAKKRLNLHKHSTPSTSKRIKVTSVDDEVDDTDIEMLLKYSLVFKWLSKLEVV